MQPQSKANKGTYLKRDAADLRYFNTALNANAKTDGGVCTCTSRHFSSSCCTGGGGTACVRGVPAHSNTRAAAKNIQRKGGEDDREQEIKANSLLLQAGLTHEHKIGLIAHLTHI